jgi:hypothetical protein
LWCFVGARFLGLSLEGSASPGAQPFVILSVAKTSAPSRVLCAMNLSESGEAGACPQEQ